jgi:hypothetical protein
VRLTLRGTRTFTGTVVLGTVSYPVSGQFDLNGDFTATVGTPPVTLALHVNFGGNSTDLSVYTFTGTVGATTVAGRHASYANTQPAPEAGTFTVLLSATDPDPFKPQGTGYGVLTIDAHGGARLVGKLGDSTAFSIGGTLIGGPNGNQLVVYSTVNYTQKGLLAGVLTFQPQPRSDCDGQLHWVKPAQAKGGYYRTGFDTQTAAIGARYAVPAAKTRVLNFGGKQNNGAVDLSGGNLVASVHATLTLATTNAVVVGTPNATRLTLAFAPKTGLFTGRFLHPLSHLAVPLSGVLYQKEPQAGGHFLGPLRQGVGYSGKVVIVPQ